MSANMTTKICNWRNNVLHLLKSGYTQISVSTFHTFVHKAPLYPPIADFITLSPAPLWLLS